MKDEKQQIRQEFRRVVFERDGYRCVVPGCRVREEANLDAHHILSRKIMPEGGYTLDNGVTLCKEKHHLEAEEGKIQVLDLRKLIGQYAGDFKHTFRKYPKTAKHPDFPTPEPEDEDDPESPKYSNTVDWRFMDEHFRAGYIAEEKLDGSNFSVGLNITDGNGSPYLQTRGQVADPHTMNFLSSSHERVVKTMIQWAWENLEIIQKLPPAWMVYGEWLRYRHTVPYYELPIFFIAFAIHDGTSFWKPLETRALLNGLGFANPPLVDLPDLKDRTIERATRKGAYTQGAAEGVVIKSLSDGSVVKWVRREFRNEMEKHGHWRRRPLEDNALATQPWARPKQAGTNDG